MVLVDFVMYWWCLKLFTARAGVRSLDLFAKVFALGLVSTSSERWMINSKVSHVCWFVSRKGRRITCLVGADMCTVCCIPQCIYTWYRCVAWTLRNPKETFNDMAKNWNIQWHQHELNAIHMGGRTLKQWLWASWFTFCPSSCFLYNEGIDISQSLGCKCLKCDIFIYFRTQPWLCYRVWRSYLKTIRAIASEVLMSPCLGEGCLELQVDLELFGGGQLDIYINCSW